jgi:hypothetical protein
MHASLYMEVATFYIFNIFGMDTFKYTGIECKPNFVCKYEV